MKKSIIISILIFILLTGCSQIHEPALINVPVGIKYHKPNLPKKPYLLIESITSESPPSEVIKAYVSSIIALEGYSSSLENILSAYNQ